MTVTGTSTSTNRTRTRAVVVGAAVGSAVAVWAVLSPLLGQELAAKQGGSTVEVGAGQVAVVAGLMSLAGCGLLAVLERGTASAIRVWTMVAIACCGVSLLGPLGNGIGTGSKLGLAALHLVVAAVLMTGLRRTVSPQR